MRVPFHRSCLGCCAWVACLTSILALACEPEPAQPKAGPSAPTDGPVQAPVIDAERARAVLQPDELPKVPLIAEKPIVAPLPAVPAPQASPRIEAKAELEKLAKKSLGNSIRNHYRLYLQLDKPLYQPGETVWVKLWGLEASSFRVEADTPFVRLSLFDPKGVLIEDQRLEATRNRSHSDFALAPGIEGGEYILRATSGDWSAERSFIVNAYEPPRIKKQLEFVRKAYGPSDEVRATLELARPNGEALSEHAVEARIRLDGEDLPPLKTQSDARGHAMLSFTLPSSIRLGDGLLTVMVEDGGVTESISKRIPIVMKKLRVELFPEGGKLVEGLPSRVYFEARTPLGKPADVEGELLDGSGNAVGQFASLRDGLGRFELTPQAGQSYSVRIVRPEGIDELYPLPAAQKQGCVLHSFDDFDGEQTALRVGVRCSSARNVVLTASLRGRDLDLAKLRVPKGELAVAYLQPQNEARAQGIAQVTLYSEKLQPLAERLVYRNRRNGLQIELRTEPSSFMPRDKLTLTIETKDSTGRAVPAELALSVVDDTVLSFADDKRAHMLAAMYLRPELLEPPEEPNFYFDLRELDSAAAMDLLMGTRGYRSFERIDVGEKRSTQPEQGRQDLSWRAAPQPLAQQQASNNSLLGADRDASGFDAMSAWGEFDTSAAVGTTAGSYSLNGSRDNTKAEGFGVGRIGTSSRKKQGNGTELVSGVKLKVGTPEVNGSLDVRIIRKVVNQHREEIKLCFGKEIRKGKPFQGSIGVKWTIDATGGVPNAFVIDTTLKNSTVENCLVRSIQHWRFPAPRNGGMVIVSYPFVFESTLSEGRPQPRQPQHHDDFNVSRIPVRDGRVFPVPDYSGAFDGVRNDFRETIFWTPRVRTNGQGFAELSFYLNDTVGSFRIVAEGVGGSQIGRAEKVFASTLPFSMSVKLPLEVSAGDMLIVPVTFENTRERELEVMLSADFGPMLQLSNSEATRTLRLEPNSRQSLNFALDVRGSHGRNRVKLLATADGLVDAFERDLNVQPRGFPAELSHSGTLTTSASFAFDLSDAEPGTVHTEFQLVPSALANMQTSYDGMLRNPTGCFEQASSSNYPNVMITQFLQTQGNIDLALLKRTHELLGLGYKKLISYESKDGGFEWFGSAPAHEALTAYALLQLADMRKVYAVDAALFERTSKWLLSRRDGQGGYQSRVGFDPFGFALAEVSNSYITYALVRAGFDQALSPEISAQLALASSTSDTYLLGLAANTLLLLPERRGAGLRATERLVKLQSEQGSFKGSTHSITRSTGRNLALETTALALLAMLESGTHEEAAERSLLWLMENRNGNGGWGSTQATVLTLQAVTAYFAKRPVAPTSGIFELLVDGKRVSTTDYSTQSGSRIALPDFAASLNLGPHRIELRDSTGIPIPYTLRVAFHSLQADSSPQVKVSVSTALERTSVSVGESVRLNATIRNADSTGVPMTIARIGLPGALRVQSWQLEELVEQQRVDFVETHPREVIVYFRSLEGGAERVVPLDLIAVVGGEYMAPASSAYLYYSDEHKSWAPGLAVTITP